MTILNKQQQEEKRILDAQILEVAMKKNITFDEARKMMQAGQSSLSDFRIR